MDQNPFDPDIQYRCRQFGQFRYFGTGRRLALGSKPMQLENTADDKTARPRIFVFSLGFVLDRHLRKMLQAAGWRISIGLPGKPDSVGVWGRKKASRRGAAMARKQNASVVTFEDGFLRSVETGQQGAKGLSFISDRQGVYFETNRPNDLHDLILASENAPADELDRAERGVALLRHSQLSKYSFSLYRLCEL